MCCVSFRVSGFYWCVGQSLQWFEEAGPALAVSFATDLYGASCVVRWGYGGMAVACPVLFLWVLHPNHSAAPAVGMWVRVSVLCVCVLVCEYVCICVCVCGCGCMWCVGGCGMWVCVVCGCMCVCVQVCGWCVVLVYVGVGVGAHTDLSSLVG